MAQIAIGYGRLSNAQRDTGGNGLDVQEAAVRAYCQAHGLALEAWHTDDGVSGAVIMQKRPGGVAAISAARAARGVLVVAKIDRAFRSLADFALTVPRLRDAGIMLASASEGFDLATPHGWAMAAVCVVFAELERAVITERSRESRRRRAAAGMQSSPLTKYGWAFELTGNVKPNGKPEKRVVPVPEEQHVIRRILGMRQGGLSLQAIADRLNKDGIKAQRGGRWSASSVAWVLKDGRSRLSEKRVNTTGDNGKNLEMQ